MLPFLFIMLGGALIALAFALNTLFSLIRDKVPYVSTPAWAIDWLCENIPLPLLRGGGRGGVVYDIGCGDARVLTALKKKHPQISAVGIERNWWPYVLARIRTRGTGITIRRANFYTADLRDASVIFCFLLHSVMPKVESVLRRQLTPGAVVYSYGFVFPNWRPVEQVANPSRSGGSKLNVYRA